MTKHTMICADCGDTTARDFLSLAFNDADWHNTMTGHDVHVVASDGTMWALTGAGWSIIGRAVGKVL